MTYIQPMVGVQWYSNTEGLESIREATPWFELSMVRAHRSSTISYPYGSCRGRLGVLVCVQDCTSLVTSPTLGSSSSQLHEDYPVEALRELSALEGWNLEVLCCDPKGSRAFCKYFLSRVRPRNFRFADLALSLSGEHDYRPAVGSWGYAFSCA